MTARQLLPPWVSRGVIGIVLATFFSDVGHEMVTAVLPLYLTTLHLGPAALGLMEGAADLAFSLAKLAGGFVGHHVKRKKPLTAGGYAVTALGTAAIAFVSSAVAVGALRVAAWCGRGFRSPLRDFLLADEVESTHFGRAYGVERSADMLGAVAGPLLALALLWRDVALPTLIALSIIPALLAVVFIAGFTRDKPTPSRAAAAPAASHRLPRRFWLFLVGVLLFGLGDFSRTFLIFLVADQLGGSAAAGALGAGVVAYTAHNVVSGIAALPAGRLGDRVPKWKVLAIGYALGVVTNLVLAGALTSLVGLGVAVAGSGVYIAVEETIEKSAVAELLPREQRSFGFGILACANAVGDMVSSLYVGTLLAAGQGRLAFTLAAVCGALGLVWVVQIGRRIPTPAS
jgi:MFS family permease